MQKQNRTSLKCLWEIKSIQEIMERSPEKPYTVMASVTNRNNDKMTMHI